MKAQLSSNGTILNAAVLTAADVAHKRVLCPLAWRKSSRCGPRDGMPMLVTAAKVWRAARPRRVRQSSRESWGTSFADRAALSNPQMQPTNAGWPELR
jgi:hypothetical protein